ncbi:MAG: hypothetical protein EAS49_16975 [Brucella intermedia]|nr:MAG: hypothetical protein EAS49_16975 [Brucella intermedia]
MRHVDFSPLYRSTVGFDRLFTMLVQHDLFRTAPDASGIMQGGEIPLWRIPCCRRPLPGDRKTHLGTVLFHFKTSSARRFTKHGLSRCVITPDR